MRLIYYSIMIWCIIITFFCYGMNRYEYVAVKTNDQRMTLVNKSNIHQALVLDVLYAHQMKKTSNSIIIPSAVNEHNNITAKDVSLLNDLLEKNDKQCKKYLREKSFYEKISYAQAAYALGAEKHFFHVINSLFTQDIKNCIGNHMITHDVQEYLIKKIIKKKENIQPQEIDENECWLTSSLDGSCFYIPFQILKYQNTIAFSGKNPFNVEIFLRNEGNLPIRAMSSNKQFSVIQKGTDDDQELLLYSTKNSSYLYSITKKDNSFSNQGIVKRLVFNKNENCLVVGSNSSKKNLFCWIPYPHLNNTRGYKLSGHNGAIGPVIIDSKGIYIVSSSKDKMSVVVWDVNNEVSHRLYHNDGPWVRAIAFSDNDTLLWICAGTTIYVWEKNHKTTFDLIHTIEFKDHDAFICKMLVLEKIRRVVVGRTNGAIQIVCMNTYKNVNCLFKHEQAIKNLIANDFGNILISSTHADNNNLIIWDIAEGSCLAHLVGHGHIRAILMTYDAQYVISQAWNNILLWQMYDENEQKILEYIKQSLPFLSCYYLYHVYKMEKNNYNKQPFKSALLKSLHNNEYIKNFVEKYL